MVWNYIVIALMAAVPAVAYWKKALNLSAAFLAAFMIFVAFTAGAKCAFFIIAAFLLISVIDKACHSKLLSTNEDITLKTGTRDAIQVLVNGGVAMVCVLLWHITGLNCWLLCFASSLVESFGDSAASDIGIAAKQQAYDICRLKKVTSGLSGGVTAAGTLGCLAACALMSGLAFAFRIASTPGELCLLIVASFMGCILDSVFGSLLQRKNKCSVCGKITEKSVHCHRNTEFYSGIKVINNDVVNLLCNVFSAMVMLLLAGIG